MAENFEQEEYDGTSAAALEGYRAVYRDYLGLGTCDNCDNAEDSPAEEAWLKLMTAVPKKAQEFNMRDPGMAMPNDMTVAEFVGKLRPANPEPFSLEHIREEWEGFRDVLEPVASTLRNGLKELSAGWKGKDFDAFEDEVTELGKKLDEFYDDIGGDGGTISLLSEQESTLASMQGAGGETPYPSVHIDQLGSDINNWFKKKWHARAPYTAECEEYGSLCNDADGNKILELGGFNPDQAAEATQWRDDRTNYLYEFYNRPDVAESHGEKPGWYTREKAEAEAEEEYSQKFSESSSDPSGDFEARAEENNSAVMDRYQTADDDLPRFTPTAGSAEESPINPDDVDVDPYDPPTVGDPNPADIKPPGTGEFDGSTVNPSGVDGPSDWNADGDYSVEPEEKVSLFDDSAGPQEPGSPFGPDADWQSEAPGGPNSPGAVDPNFDGVDGIDGQDPSEWEGGGTSPGAVDPSSPRWDDGTSPDYTDPSSPDWDGSGKGFNPGGVPDDDYVVKKPLDDEEFGDWDFEDDDSTEGGGLQSGSPSVTGMSPGGAGSPSLPGGGGGVSAGGGGPLMAGGAAGGSGGSRDGRGSGGGGPMGMAAGGGAVRPGGAMGGAIPPTGAAGAGGPKADEEREASDEYVLPEDRSVWGGNHEEYERGEDFLT
ncbi:WXG100 family type VII secretion target [Salininema proteolyticum]|uniref:WXG100 family type VII secretion target n=1 Tax=Salininema proteolyticum TaxID=1607685 RepID=A0ABV8TV24_9ACTN